VKENAADHTCSCFCLRWLFSQIQSAETCVPWLTVQDHKKRDLDLKPYYLKLMNELCDIILQHPVALMYHSL
jgi:hypothetical protein